jgi:hypothetical protein
MDEGLEIGFVDHCIDSPEKATLVDHIFMSFASKNIFFFVIFLLS